MVLSWVTSTSAGHTKKLATNGIFLVGYALGARYMHAVMQASSLTCLSCHQGQILCTQFWKTQYKPRNYVPWGITLASYAGDWVILLALRYYLQRENTRRDRALAASGLEGAGNEKAVTHQEVFGYVEKIGPDGVVVRQKVEKALLDLTVSFYVSTP